MSEYARLPLVQNPLKWITPGPDRRTLTKSDDKDEQFVKETGNNNWQLDTPEFKHYEQTTNIQLFFDLFFVANLTSFTNAHEVNSKGALTSYVGFFCLLWFTWCQVTLYDVRFATDCVLERLAHGCHLGIMVGLAIVGPLFNDLSSDTPWGAFQALSLILMASRLILFCQYGSTLTFTWRFTKTRLPLILVMASLLVVSLIYFGISIAFARRTSISAWRGWYATAVFEVGFNIAVAAKWRIVSFKNTNLVERMSCLTLIILGEGVIGLCKSITKIEALDFDFTLAAIGSIIAAVLIIYLFYMLYFDNLQNEHFGTIRQQIWAFAHFPFHLALVLTMEGTNQFVSWRHIIEFINRTFSPIDMVYASPTSTNLDFLVAMNSTVQSVLNSGVFSVTQETFEKAQASIDTLVEWATAKEATANLTWAANTATERLYSVMFETIFDSYDFEPPRAKSTNGTSSGMEGAASTSESLDGTVTQYYAIFELIFAYFFIASGLCLIGIGALSWLSLMKEEFSFRNNKLRFVGIIACFVFGLGTTLVSTIVTSTAADVLGESPLTLVVLLGVLSIVFVCNHIPKRKRDS